MMMTGMSGIFAGADLLFQWEVFIWLLLGLIAGFLVGVLPGFEATNAVAILLPFSISLSTEAALLLMTGVYAGASFAGAVPAILMNVPGTAGTAATALDGYPLALRGQAGMAIGVARMASTVGGVFSGLIALIIIGPLAAIALSFGTPEVFLVALIGLFVIGAVVGDSPRKGLLSAFFGLGLAAMSVNPLNAAPRFTLGIIDLYEGLPFIPVIIGLFAFSQMFLAASGGATAAVASASSKVDSKANSNWLREQARQAIDGARETFRYPATLARSTIIGGVIGIIPGMGTAVSNFIAYADAKSRSKDPDSFGRGNPEGIVASEACENAVVTGTLIPTLTLGIPGSSVAAVMLAALYLHGVQPGPRVMETHSAEVYAVMIGVLVASALILPLGVLLAAPLTLISRLSPQVLVPPVLLVCVVGTYAFRNSMFDVWLTLLFGLLGVAMRLTGFPVVPLVLGIILGPIIEATFLRSLLLGRGSPTIFFASTISRILWLVILALIVAVVFRRIRRGRHRSEDMEHVVD